MLLPGEPMQWNHLTVWREPGIKTHEHRAETGVEGSLRITKFYPPLLQDTEVIKISQPPPWQDSPPPHSGGTVVGAPRPPDGWTRACEFQSQCVCSQVLIICSSAKIVLTWITSLPLCCLSLLQPPAITQKLHSFKIGYKTLHNVWARLMAW